MGESVAAGKAPARRDVEIILGVAVVLALVNLAVTLLLRGYEFEAAGLSVRSNNLGRPLFILLALIAVRWLVGLGRIGFVVPVKSFSPWGIFGLLLGLAVFWWVVRQQPVSIPTGMSVTVGALVLLGYFLAWLAWGPPFPAVVRAVILVLFVLLSWGLAESLARPRSWSRLFAIENSYFAENVEVTADAAGILTGKGTGSQLRKAPIDNDWRDAVAVAAGGYYSVKVHVEEDSVLSFSVASSGAAAAATAMVTALSDGAQERLWQADAAGISRTSWSLVTVDVPAAGETELVFELDESQSPVEVLFANPRLLKKSPPRAVNVILVVVDALRADRLGLYGYGRATSREIDELAKSAVVFENCSAQAPWTLPSTASILSSLYPTAHGLVSIRDGFSPSIESVVEKFRDAGYFTGAVQTNSTLAPERGVTQGFNEYRYLPAKSNPTRFERAEVVNNHALEWLERNNAVPFFLYLHYMDVHKPYMPPDGFAGFGDDPSDLYDGEIAYFSSEFSKLFAELRSRGLLSSTLVIFTADHGEQFMEHGSIDHGNCLHSEEIHVPLIVWTPGGAKGRVVKNAVNSVDVAPTLLDLAGIEPMKNAHGNSLRRAIAGEEPAAGEVFSELYTYKPAGQHLVSLTEGDYRLIVFNPGNDKATCYELYNLAADAQEYVNLAAQNPELVRRAAASIDRFVANQRELHHKLVPETVDYPLTEERIEHFKNLGYLQ